MGVHNLRVDRSDLHVGQAGFEVCMLVGHDKTLHSALRDSR